MERLCRLEHHEVGDIDDIVDGAEADRLETLAKPIGAGADLHPIDATDAVEGRCFECCDRGHGGVLLCGGKSRSRGDELTAIKGRGFPGNTEMTEPVGTIRRDLDLKDLLRRKEVAQGSADRGLR